MCAKTMQHRTVLCVGPTGRTVPERMCPSSLVPAATRSCWDSCLHTLQEKDEGSGLLLPLWAVIVLVPLALGALVAITTFLLLRKFQRRPKEAAAASHSRSAEMVAIPMAEPCTPASVYDQPLERASVQHYAAAANMSVSKLEREATLGAEDVEHLYDEHSTPPPMRTWFGAPTSDKQPSSSGAPPLWSLELGLPCLYVCPHPPISLCRASKAPQWTK